jgi:actin-related protein 6
VPVPFPVKILRVYHTDGACRLDPKGNSIVQEYILPDLSTNRKGRIRRPDDIVTETDQVLVMNNERFSVPEVIFRPDDIGMSFSYQLFFAKF